MKQEEIERIVDEACDQYENDLKQGNPQRIPQVLDASQPEIRKQLLEELLALEFEMLDAVQIRENLNSYIEQLPQHRGFLQERLESQTNHRSTAAKSTSSRHIGNYKLLQEIGTGGMGSVWMAQQEKPVQRRVALKIIKKGLGSKEVVARFEAERQAVALMDHPNIAKILDAGTTDDGYPFFAMELVDGVPLTDYCDQHQLRIAERLDVFRQVCEGVQHAHQKGILHRDLKPSNILVTEYDGQPVPKIIDFGLAKAMDVTTKLTDKTMFTEFGQVIGTLRYMSPEQAGLDSLDIDTRSDIYALGVILYELLTGSTPLDDDSIKGNALLKILELVREFESPKPSSRLSTTREDSLEAITARRKTTTKRLGQILSGDLDWIVMKAVEKDRERRYETANGLAEDIQRYVNNEPVMACPPNKIYRLKKFIAKNRGLVGALAAVSAALIVGIIGTTWFAFESSKARKNAESASKIARANEAKALASQQQTRDAINEFFTTVSEEELLETPGLQPLRKKLLEKANRYYHELADDELPQGSRMLVAKNKSRYAIMTQKLGDVDAAIKLLEEALEIADDVDSPDQDDLKQAFRIDNLSRLASYQQSNSNLKAARVAASESLKLARPWHQKVNSDTSRLMLADALVTASRISRREGQSTRQLEEADEVRELLAETVENNPVGSASQAYGEALSMLIDVVPTKQGTVYQDKLIEISRAMRTAEPTRLFNIQVLAGSLTDKASKMPPAKTTEAFELFIEAERYWTELHQQSPAVERYRRGLAKNLDLHAFCKHQAGRHANKETQQAWFVEALEKYNLASQILRARFTETEPPEIDLAKVDEKHFSLLAMVLNGQALVCRDLERRNEAVRYFEAAIALQERLVANSPESFGPHMDLAGSKLNLGLTLAAFEDFKASLKYHRKAIASLQKLMKQFPEQKQLHMHEINFSMAQNNSLFVSQDGKLIDENFIDVMPVFDIAEQKTGNDLSLRRTHGKQQSAIKAILDGDLTEFRSFMNSEFNTPAIQQPMVLSQGAAYLTAAHIATKESDTITSAERSQVIEWGGMYLDKLMEGGMPLDEIKKEKRLNYLLIEAESDEE